MLIVRAHGPPQRTAVRRITPQENERFERIHEEVYLETGYRLIEVPPARSRNGCGRYCG
ncbi:MAG: ATP-binding protein [Actinomycetota bacterium]|nr:ATP-binding protein [Actinomycetota bacterium]